MVYHLIQEYNEMPYSCKSCSHQCSAVQALTCLKSDLSGPSSLQTNNIAPPKVINHHNSRYSIKCCQMAFTYPTSFAVTDCRPLHPEVLRTNKHQTFPTREGLVSEARHTKLAHTCLSYLRRTPHPVIEYEYERTLI